MKQNYKNASHFPSQIVTNREEREEKKYTRIISNKALTPSRGGTLMPLSASLKSCHRSRVSGPSQVSQAQCPHSLHSESSPLAAAASVLHLCLDRMYSGTIMSVGHLHFKSVMQPNCINRWLVA